MSWAYSCKKVAELISRSLDEPLDLIDRIRMRMHVSLCGNCRNVKQQLTELQALTAHLYSSDGNQGEQSGSASDHSH